MPWLLRHFLIHCFNLSFQPNLLRAQLVDPPIVARDALFEQMRELNASIRWMREPADHVLLRRPD